jgi:hypothetical protein
MEDRRRINPNFVKNLPDEGITVLVGTQYEGGFAPCASRERRGTVSLASGAEVEESSRIGTSGSNQDVQEEVR